MRWYRIMIWSRDQARLVDHDAIPMDDAGDEVLLERIAAAGRAALGWPAPRSADAIVTASSHLREALRLLEGG